MKQKSKFDKIGRRLIKWEKAFKDNNWDYVVIMFLAWAVVILGFETENGEFENTTLLIILTICTWSVILLKIIRAFFKRKQKDDLE